MTVPSTLASLSTTPGSNPPAGTDPIAPELDNHLRQMYAFFATHRDQIAAMFQYGTEIDVASASTVSIGAQSSPVMRITGTTTITSFGTTYKGPIFIRFAAALTLTHNATSLILPGGSSITTAAEDIAIAMPKASAGTANGWIVYYQRASGQPLVTVPDATETVKGIVELATTAEAITGTDTTRAVTPAGVAAKVASAVVDASTSAKGIVELATTAETQSGTDATRAVTPSGIGNTVIGFGQTWQDLTASRAAGTTYTNSTGRTIAVSVVVSGGDGHTQTLSVSGVTVAQAYRLGAATTQQLYADISPSGTYQLTVSGGSIVTWAELR